MDKIKSHPALFPAEHSLCTPHFVSQMHCECHLMFIFNLCGRFWLDKVCLRSHARRHILVFPFEGLPPKPVRLQAYVVPTSTLSWRLPSKSFLAENTDSLRSAAGFLSLSVDFWEEFQLVNRPKPFLFCALLSSVQAQSVLWFLYN